MVISISVDSFSSLMRLSTIAVKSGAGVFDSGFGCGVWVAMRVYAGMSSLWR
jgi:hypothetical protein